MTKTVSSTRGGVNDKVWHSRAAVFSLHTFTSIHTDLIVFVHIHIVHVTMHFWFTPTENLTWTKIVGFYT